MIERRTKKNDARKNGERKYVCKPIASLQMVEFAGTGENPVDLKILYMFCDGYTDTRHTTVIVSMLCCPALGHLTIKAVLCPCTRYALRPTLTKSQNHVELLDLFCICLKQVHSSHRTASFRMGTYTQHTAHNRKCLDENWCLFRVLYFCRIVQINCEADVLPGWEVLRYGTFKSKYRMLRRGSADENRAQLAPHSDFVRICAIRAHSSNT